MGRDYVGSIASAYGTKDVSVFRVSPRNDGWDGTMSGRLLRLSEL